MVRIARSGRRVARVNDKRSAMFSLVIGPASFTILTISSWRLVSSKYNHSPGANLKSVILMLRQGNILCYNEYAVTGGYSSIKPLLNHQFRNVGHFLHLIGHIPQKPQPVRAHG